MADPVIPPSNNLPDSEEVRLVSTARSRGDKMYRVPLRVHDMDVRIHNRSRSAYASIEFIHIHSEIKADRDFLIQKFPKGEFPKFVPSFQSKLEWCIFCLGSKLSARIYSDLYREPVREIIGHSPLLGIVLHLDEDDIFTLLMYFKEWFSKIGMTVSLGEWMYAVLSCVGLPLSKDIRQIMQAMADDCEERVLICKDPFERVRLYRISAILDVRLFKRFT